MCVIIHKKAGLLFPEKDVLSAHRVNNDGFGYMFFDKEQGKMVAKKAVFKSGADIVKIFNDFKDQEVCFHFRKKTHGKISDEACHPFRLLHKDRHGFDAFLMHNGVISGVNPDKDESDTQAFVRNIMQPMLKAKPTLLYQDAFKTLVEGFIGRNNKLLIMFGNGNVIKFNELQGDKYLDCWVSNKYCFDTYTYTDNRKHHHNNGSHSAYRPRCGVGDSEEEMAEFFREQYGPQRIPDNVVDLTKKDGSKAILMGEEVGIGDPVYIWREDGVDFFGEGKITEFSFNSVVIEFKDEQQITVKVSFFLKDGKSIGINKLGYLAVPVTFGDPNKSKTVKEIEDEEEKKRTEQKPETPTTTSGNGTQDTATEALPPLAPDRSLAIVSARLDEDKKKVSGEDSLLVSLNGLTVDSTERHGGAWLEDSFESYDGVTIMDVYNMGAQERFNFFRSEEHATRAFGMFQDLVEHYALDDIEFDPDNFEDDAEENLKKVNNV